MVDYGNKYDRLYVTIVTPYKDDGSLDVDESQLRKFLQYFLQKKFLDAGVGIIINPEAGELFYLTREEKLRNLQITLEEVKGRVPVFSGVCQPTTAGTVQEAVDAKKAGADGIFAMPAIGALDVTTAWDSTKYPEVCLITSRPLSGGSVTCRSSVIRWVPSISAMEKGFQWRWRCRPAKRSPMWSAGK